MTNDDMLCYLADHRPKDRPTEMRSDKVMLIAWIKMRNDKEFYEDVILRHGLHKIQRCDLDKADAVHEHAISNAWGHCMQWVVQNPSKPTEQGVPE